MLLQPGMIRRGLDGEIEGDLEAMLVGGSDQAIEILEGAELRMDGVMAAIGGTDCVRTARVLLTRMQRVVASLARIAGSRPMTSSKVPWRFGSPLCERGKIWYQLAKPAACRSASTG
jgi:hypothetical protein